MHTSLSLAPTVTGPADEYPYFARESCFSFKSLAWKLGRLTPRLLIAGYVGYHILGWAYMHGWMNAIDQIALRIMRYYELPYATVGWLMPKIQAYASWGVQGGGAAGAALAYDLSERVILCSIPFFTPEQGV